MNMVMYTVKQSGFQVTMDMPKLPFLQVWLLCHSHSTIKAGVRPFFLRFFSSFLLRKLSYILNSRNGKGQWFDSVQVFGVPF